MDEIIPGMFSPEKDASEKAALRAEEIMDLLPAETALAVRRCIVLHWFDLSIVEALLEEQELTIDAMSDIYQQIAALPFIDAIHLGLTFHSATRQGLLRAYSVKQPELLQIAARLAAPIYEAEEDEKNIAEAFFCAIIAGEQEAGIALQDALLEQGMHDDWHYYEKLSHLQDEAESLPFVQPLPRTEQHYLLRGLVQRMNGQQEAALLAYNQALTLNPKSVISYINRGITYAEQENFNEALNDYNRALQIDKKAAQAYANRGVIYAKQAHYKEALRDFGKAIEAGLLNNFVLRHQGETLYQLERYDEALASYDAMLRLDAEDTDAYRGQGQAYNQLGKYEQALASFEEALRFNPDSADVYREKGSVLNQLERYVDALVAYNKALELDAYSAEGYRGKGKALRGLKRYEEVTIAYMRADELDPQNEDEAEMSDNTDVQDRKRAMGSARLWERVPQLLFLALPSIQNRPRASVRRGGVPVSLSVWTTPERISATVAAIILFIFILIPLLFFALTSRTLTGGFGNYATATAQSRATAAASQSSASTVLQGCTADSTNTGAKPSSSTQSQPCSFTLQIASSGLLNNSISAINDVEQQVRSVPLLKGHYVALAIVFAGAPTDSDIAQAQAIAQKIDDLLRDSKSGPSFSKASFYDPLYLLGDPANTVKVDIYLFNQNNTSKNRLELAYHRITLQINANGLLNNTSSAISNMEQQIRGQSFLRNRTAGLVIAYGGAPDDTSISTAQVIASKTYDILRTLGKEDPTFKYASYYDPLFTLGNDTNTIVIDIYLFTP